MPALPNNTPQKTPGQSKGQHPQPNDPNPVPPPRGNQESQHNKHNEPGQAHHKPQKHTPAEEKH
jgi:hypothetical protein